jgi:hypothetical protein
VSVSARGPAIWSANAWSGRLGGATWRGLFNREVYRSDALDCAAGIQGLNRIMRWLGPSVPCSAATSCTFVVSLGAEILHTESGDMSVFKAFSTTSRLRVNVASSQVLPCSVNAAPRAEVLEVHVVAHSALSAFAKHAFPLGAKIEAALSSPKPLLRSRYRTPHPFS